MIRGLYSAATGLNAMSVQQDVTARNLSEATKPGYLRRVARFEAVGDKQNLLGTSPSIHTDFTPGPPQFTGNKYDVVIVPEPTQDGRAPASSFFELEGPNGPLYTRNGVFVIDGQGVLLNYNGMPVRGNVVGDPNQPTRIIVPPTTQSVDILDDGVVVADGGFIVAQLRIATFDDPTVLERAGTALFQTPANVTPRFDTINVRQGYRAAANTTVTNELINMVFGLRQFEASQRAMRTLDEAISLATRPRQQ